MILGVGITWWLFCMGHSLTIAEKGLDKDIDIFQWIIVAVFCVIMTPITLGCDIAKYFNSSKTVVK